MKTKQAAKRGFNAKFCNKKFRTKDSLMSSEQVRNHLSLPLLLFPKKENKTKQLNIIQSNLSQQQQQQQKNIVKNEQIWMNA